MTKTTENSGNGGFESIVRTIGADIEAEVEDE